MKLIKYEPPKIPIHISDLQENCYFKFKNLHERIFVFDKKRQPHFLPDCFIFNETVTSINVNSTYVEQNEIEKIIFTKINFKYKVVNTKLSRVGKTDWFSSGDQTIRNVSSKTFFRWNQTNSLCYKLNEYIFYSLYPDRCSDFEVKRFNDNSISEVEIESIEYDISTE